MSEADKQTVLVLFSGGQDSAIVLGWALKRFERVQTLGFDYQQRHQVELEARQRVLALYREEFQEGERLGKDDVIATGSWKGITQSALLSEKEIALDKESGLPQSFVPGRNLIFLVLAAAYGYERGIRQLAAGMCEIDASGYPDCREAALRTQMEAISTGMDSIYHLHTPLISKSKAQAWHMLEMMSSRSFVERVVTETHSCYKGIRERKYEWGYGCGDCPACKLRREGYEAYIRFRKRH